MHRRIVRQALESAIPSELRFEASGARRRKQGRTRFAFIMLTGAALSVNFALRADIEGQEALGLHPKVLALVIQ